jgi:hypothetical protein
MEPIRKFYLDLKGQSVELTDTQPEGWEDNFGVEIRRVAEDGCYRVRRVVVTVTERGCSVSLLGEACTTWVTLGCSELQAPEEGRPWDIPDLPKSLTTKERCAAAWLRAESVAGVSPEELEKIKEGIGGLAKG